jgi:hypothetical protein
MTDPLAQYRKKPVAGTATETPAPPQAPTAYLAFDAKDNVDRLSIRQANSQSRSPGYAYLLDITHDGPFGTNFVLYYSFMLVVMVEGRNLLPVIQALQMGSAEFIQEFDPDRWEVPTDSKAPFIESIKIVVEQGGPSSGPQKKSDEGKERGRSLH